MKNLIIVSVICLSTTGIAQTVFSKVRNNMAAGRNVKEIKTLDSCFTAGYFKDSALYYKTIINIKMGSNQSAKRSLSSLEKLYPEFKEINYLKGLVLFSDGNYARSVEAFNEAAKDNAQSTKVFYNRSVALGMMQDYPAAINDLDICTKLEPDYALAHYSKGYWYELSGNYLESAKNYEQSIKLNPKNYDAYVGLAYCCRKTNDITKACETINSAIKEGSQIAQALQDTFCK